MTVRFLAAAALSAALPALAQTLPDAGGALRDLEKPAPALPRKPPPRLELEPPARPPLSDPTRVRFQLRGFTFAGNSAFAEADLGPLVAEFIGREVGFAELEQAAARITRHYRSQGYLVARAYLPAQDIRDGVVEIAVLEGRLGKLELRNRSHVRDEAVAGYFAGITGDVVHEARLERKLLLLSDLAGIGPAAAALRPGDRVGESALALSLAEPAEPIVPSVELDNYGSYYTGEYRLSAQVDVASPVGRGDAFTVRGTKGMPGLEAVRLGYQLPLGGDGVRLALAYSGLRYRLGREFSPLHAHGRAIAASATLSYPLVRSRNRNVHAQAGLARRSLTDEIDATSALTDKSSETGTLGLAGDWRDALGGGGANAYAISYSAGELDIRTPAARAADEASLQTHGSFAKLNWNLLRAQRISERFSALASLSGQLASRNLDSSEKFALGGPYGVRASPLGEGAGDEGVLLSAELRFDIVPASVQVFGFVDAGEVKLSRNPVGTARNRERLAAAGAGVNWNSRGGFSARATVASGNDLPSSGPDRRPRTWLQLAQRF